MLHKGYVELAMELLISTVREDITEVELWLALGCAAAVVDSMCSGVWEAAEPADAILRIILEERG